MVDEAVSTVAFLQRLRRRGELTDTIMQAITPDLAMWWMRNDTILAFLE